MEPNVVWAQLWRPVKANSRAGPSGWSKCCAGTTFHSTEAREQPRRQKNWGRTEIRRAGRAAPAGAAACGGSGLEHELRLTAPGWNQMWCGRNFGAQLRQIPEQGHLGGANVARAQHFTPLKRASNHGGRKTGAEPRTALPQLQVSNASASAIPSRLLRPLRSAGPELRGADGRMRCIRQRP